MKDVLKDLTGMRFGKLIVLERAEDYIEPKSKKKHAQWLCQCDCRSKPKVILGSNLKKGATKSCGCLLKETASLTHKQNNYYENIENNITKVFFNNSDEFFICDTNEWENLKNITWIKDSQGYVYGVTNDKHVRLHRLLMEVEDEIFDVDHRDGNTLNNCKNNLRVCKHQQNMINQNKRIDNNSGHKGVHFDKERNKWVASLTIKGKRVLWKRFDKLEDAVKVRKDAEVKYFGEYNPINYRHKDCSPRTLSEIIQANKTN